MPSPSHPAVALAVSNLSKRFGGSEVVAGLSFSVGAGSCFGLLGLTIPLLHRSLKQAAESKPTGPAGI